MTALTLPLAPLYVERQPHGGCVNGAVVDLRTGEPLGPCEWCYHGPSLAEWATLDRPDVECETCERGLVPDLDERCNCGYGGFHEPLNPRCDRNKSCPDCTAGRRLLAVGDRVTLVEDGSYPGSHYGDVYLPCSGTVVGTAVVDWVGPVVDGDECRAAVTPGPYPQHVCVNSHRVRAVYSSERGEDITDHSHVDWAPGRTAIRLREAVAS